MAASKPAASDRDALPPNRRTADRVNGEHEQLAAVYGVVY
jgi:hypothetical protein